MLTFVDRASTVNETSDYENYTVIDSIVDMSDGYSYGLEIFIQKKTGRLNGCVIYTYSISRKLFNDMEYYTNWDRTHAFNILGNYRLSKKWDFNFKWTYQTGQPNTPILGYYSEFEAEKDMNISVVPVGYADGLNRRFGDGKGNVLVNGIFCPIIGKICMDSFIISTTKVNC